MDSWQKLSDIVERVTDRLAPVVINVELAGTVAVALYAEAMRSGIKPETLAAEAVRSYLGDAS
jgi:hypothetical protein